jgi:uncharacterized RDD family membrane protein YckC
MIANTSNQLSKYHTASARLYAAVVDMIVFWLLAMLQHVLVGSVQAKPALMALGVFNGLLPLLYSVIGHYAYGQTLGKWVAGIKVVDVSETKGLSLRQCIYRDAFYIIMVITGILNLWRALYFGDSASWERVDEWLSPGALIWCVVELLSMLTNSKRRAVHDYLARSVVVKTGS